MDRTDRRPIELRSDNCAGADPAVLAAMADADVGSADAYGDDSWTSALRDRVAEVFEQPVVDVFPVGSGTAANALALSALCPPWGAVLGHASAHIATNEANATALFAGGAAIHHVGGPDAKIAPDVLADVLDRTGWGDPHRSQPAVLSVTQATDLGTVYTAEEIAELVAIVGPRELRVHVDGARLANALVATGATPADLTWRGGVDVLSLGAIKNGGLGADVIVCFDPEVADQLRYRLKRSGHVASKMRFLSAQLLAYLDDDRWLANAHLANAAMARLLAGLADLGIHPDPVPQANLAFLDLPTAVADRWERSGVRFYRIEDETVRLVTSFQTTDDDVDDALARLRIALAVGS